MTRSHPPTLIKIVERTLREECRLAPGEHVLVAVSGGGDSTALLHVLGLLAPRLGVTITAHGVDHGLRPEASKELDLAEELATRWGIPFGRTRVVVRRGGNLQARARAARRAALLEAAREAAATRIATAHHADDRAETVLMRLLHGARARSLAVLPPSDGRFVRPMIRARKAAVIAHLTRHTLPYATDPSNDDPRFLRVRLRKEVLPLLEVLSPQVVEHLNGLSDEVGLHEPEPRLFDGTGRPVALRSAHVRALRRAQSLGRAARIRLPGDRELVVESVGRPKDARREGREVRVDPARPIERPRPNERKGGAKSEKRG
jgi:tRNA(Ile)-lysidine synthase